MFNQVVLVGFLTRDVEVRYLTSGTAVANFGIATNKKYGEDKQETFFGEITAWGKLAEICGQYLSKGSKVLISGRLITESWEKDGVKKSKTRITAEQVKFLDNKQSGSDGAAGSVPQESTHVEPF